MTMRTGLVLVAAAASAALLAGCTSTSSQVEVTYDGAAHSVSLGEVECSFTDSRSSMRLANDDEALAVNGLPTFDASYFGAENPTPIVTIKVSEGVYFQSFNHFELTKDGFDVTDLDGEVSVVKDGDIVETLDWDATLTAHVAC